MNNEQEIKELKKRIDALEKWQKERKLQQITYPLDIQSFKVLVKYFMSIVSLVDMRITGVGDRRLFTYLGIQDSQRFQVTPQTLFKYNANATSNTLTLADASLPNDTAVYLYSDGTYPAPLDVDIIYYVVNSAGNTLQLSLTSGGAAINLTDAGTGQQYIQVTALV